MGEGRYGRGNADSSRALGQQEVCSSACQPLLLLKLQEEPRCTYLTAEAEGPKRKAHCKGPDFFHPCLFYEGNIYHVKPTG